MIAHNANLITLLVMEERGREDLQRRFTVPERDTSVAQAAGIILSVLGTLV